MNGKSLASQVTARAFAHVDYSCILARSLHLAVRAVAVSSTPLSRCTSRCAALGGALVVGDHDDGLAELAVQAVHQLEHLGRRDPVEVAGRLVGHEDRPGR